MAPDLLGAHELMFDWQGILRQSGQGQFRGPVGADVEQLPPPPPPEAPQLLLNVAQLGPVLLRPRAPMEEICVERNRHCEEGEDLPNEIYQRQPLPQELNLLPVCRRCDVTHHPRLGRTPPVLCEGSEDRSRSYPRTVNRTDRLYALVEELRAVARARHGTFHGRAHREHRLPRGHLARDPGPGATGHRAAQPVRPDRVAARSTSTPPPASDQPLAAKAAGTSQPAFRRS